MGVQEGTRPRGWSWGPPRARVLAPDLSTSPEGSRLLQLPCRPTGPPGPSLHACFSLHARVVKLFFFI